MKKDKGILLPDEEMQRIKRTALVAMVADDELLDQLVLKGGNAMDLIHGVSDRASIDLDFSVANDFDRNAVLPKVKRSLEVTFEERGYRAFDIEMVEQPGKMPDDLASFWGGYVVEFKLIQLERAASLRFDVQQMRRQAIQFGERGRFEIDISRHEYVEEKQRAEVDGYSVYVYSPEMIVCEKLRAICQQLPAYGEVIKRKSVGGKARARDFVDIEAMINKFDIDLTADRVQHILIEMFQLKKVPLSYLGQIEASKELHASDFSAVQESMRPGTKLQPFDHYFGFVLDQCQRLEPLWHM